MRFSVWNNDLQVYDVYEGPPVPRSLAGLPGETLPPSTAMVKLPNEARYLGQSEDPEGKIVDERGYTVGQFVSQVAAGLVTLWIFWRFIK